MNEQEIFEELCSYIAVDTGHPMDNPFFKHCYDICIENKNNITNKTIYKIINREVKILNSRKLELDRIAQKILGW